MDIQQSERRRRKHYSKELKQHIVSKALAGDRSVSEVAREHDVHLNLLFRWIRLAQESSHSGSSAPVRLSGSNLVPVHVRTEPVSSGVQAEEQFIELKTERISVRLPVSTSPALAQVILSGVFE